MLCICDDICYFSVIPTFGYYKRRPHSQICINTEISTASNQIVCEISIAKICGIMYGAKCNSDTITSVYISTFLMKIFKNICVSFVCSTGNRATANQVHIPLAAFFIDVGTLFYQFLYRLQVTIKSSLYKGR